MLKACSFIVALLYLDGVKFKKYWDFTFVYYSEYTSRPRIVKRCFAGVRARGSDQQQRFGPAAEAMRSGPGRHRAPRLEARRHSRSGAQHGTRKARTRRPKNPDHRRTFAAL